MTTRYQKLALAEKAAAAVQEQAEAEYRHKWWETSLALARAQRGTELTQALNDMGPILGLSRGYLTSRRGVAAKISEDVIASGEVFSLPPRKAMAYVDATKGGIIDSAAVAKLREYEEEGVSLRAMTADLMGEKPSWWRNAEEQRDAVRPTPEQVAEAIRNSPEVRRAIVENQEARVALSHAHNEMAAERTADVRFHPERDDRNNNFLNTASIAMKIDSMNRLADEIRRLLADNAPDQDTRSTYAGKLAIVGEKVNDMVHGLRSDAEFEAMMVREGLVN